MYIAEFDTRPAFAKASEAIQEPELERKPEVVSTDDDFEDEGAVEVIIVLHVQVPIYLLTYPPTYLPTSLSLSFRSLPSEQLFI